jgi:hemerythrin
MDQRPEFSDEFLVGIAEIDAEHHRLFEIAGRVYDSLNASDAAAAAVTREAVTELLDYTKTHFAHEEALMEAAAYPALKEHRELHRHLISQAHDMEMRVEFGDNYVPVELSHFLYNWLVRHIEVADKRFGEFAAARRG